MFKKTISLEFSTEIDVDTHTLFAFQTDTHNLPKITPPWIDVEIVSLELPLQKGSRIELDIKRFGLTQKWNMMIFELTSPDLVCDKALKSPFKSFMHYHRFESIGKGKSILKDEVLFSLPLYPFSLVSLPFIKKEMKKMFDYRHQETKKLLEKKQVI